MTKPKRTRSKKQNSSKKRRGGGNCGSGCISEPKENPWLAVDRESSRRTIRKVPSLDDNTNYDELKKNAQIFNEEEDQNRKEEIKNQEDKKQTMPPTIILPPPRIITSTIQRDRRTPRGGRNYKTKSRRSIKQIKHPTVHRKK